KALIRAKEIRDAVLCAARVRPWGKIGAAVRNRQRGRWTDGDATSCPKCKGRSGNQGKSRDKNRRLCRCYVRAASRGAVRHPGEVGVGSTRYRNRERATAGGQSRRSNYRSQNLGSCFHVLLQSSECSAQARCCLTSKYTADRVVPKQCGPVERQV